MQALEDCEVTSALPTQPAKVLATASGEAYRWSGFSRGQAGVEGAEVAKATTLAAQYVRMSSDSQDFSIPAQMAVNAVYAAEHGLEIIQTYSDRGVSGLDIKKRSGLKELLADVVAGTATFRTILVHDVSRWGRFQNPDQAAHYEFLCAETGVRVVYTAEPFVNDGSSTSSLLKQIKRTMAAEYSRDLSAKVIRAKRGLAERGCWMGGSPPLGIKREVEDPTGERQPYVEGGAWRKRQGFHTRLALGPPEDVELVRLVYRLFLKRDATASNVARQLNSLGHQTRLGKPWTALQVARTLKCQLYRGRMEFGRQTQDLATRVHRPLPREDWLVVEGVVPPIISERMFMAAGRKLVERAPGSTTATAALADIRRVLAQHGDISQRLLDRHGRWAASTYLRRFGSISRIREILGAPTPEKYA